MCELGSNLLLSRGKMNPDFSIIICTHNRATHLRATLESLGAVDLPGELRGELIIVDNASTDGTAELAATYRLSNLEVRYFHETRPGKANALNSGISFSKGRVLLFTDDDVRFSREWFAGMCEPILSGKAHAVQGGIHIAPDLTRPWLTPLLKDSLAHYEGPREGSSVTLIGANMAVSREVFEKVPGFDSEIGPGPSAGGEDTLFS